MKIKTIMFKTKAFIKEEYMYTSTTNMNWVYK